MLGVILFDARRWVMNIRKNRWEKEYLWTQTIQKKPG